MLCGLLLLLSIFISSCSLNYAQDAAAQSSSPEFTLRSAEFFRYDDNELSFALQSDRIEQYSSSQSAPTVTYAQDAFFQSYSDDGNIDSKGHCGLLGIEQGRNRTDAELTFFTSVVLENLSDGMVLEGEALKWNTNTRQAVSGKEEFVTLSKDNMTMEGKGFAADSETRMFSYSGEVSGTLVIEENEAEANESN